MTTTPLYQRVKDQDQELGNTIASYMAGGVMGTLTIKDPATASEVALAWDTLLNRLDVPDPDGVINGATFAETKAASEQVVGTYAGTTPLYQRLNETEPEYVNALLKSSFYIALAVENSKVDEQTKDDLRDAIDGWFGVSFGVTLPEEPAA